MHNFLDLKGLQHAIVLQYVKFNASSTALIIIFDQCKPLIFKDHKKKLGKQKKTDKFVTKIREKK